MKEHKPGCLANTHCAVYHADGVCPGPYGKCTCDEIGSTLLPSSEVISEKSDVSIHITKDEYIKRILAEYKSSLKEEIEGKKIEIIKVPYFRTPNQDGLDESYNSALDDILKLID